jgi:hypothetical protein
VISILWAGDIVHPGAPFFQGGQALRKGSAGVDIAGTRLIIINVATTPAMARASLWPLEAFSTTPSGFQA